MYMCDVPAHYFFVLSNLSTACVYACVEGDWSRSVNKLFQLFQGADGRSYVLEGVETGVFCLVYFFYFYGGLACMQVYVCGCAHTDTYSVWVLGM